MRKQPKKKTVPPKRRSRKGLSDASTEAAKRIIGKGPTAEQASTRFVRFMRSFRILSGIGASEVVPEPRPDKGFPRFGVIGRYALAHKMDTDSYIAEIERRSGVEYPRQRIHEYKPGDKRISKDPLQRMGKALRDIREAKKLSGREVAEKMGIAYQSYRAWEAGHRPIGKDFVAGLAAAFDLSKEAFLAEMEQRSGLETEEIVKQRNGWGKKKGATVRGRLREKWGQALLAVREEKGFGRTAFTKALGAKDDSSMSARWSQWDYGIVTPRRRYVDMIAKVMGMTGEELLAEIEKRSGVKHEDISQKKAL